jgi:N-acetyl-anhydromuramyl-L-alanine amidase AmpD
MRNIDHIIIHCAATQAKSDIGAVDIDKWHRAKGWFGCGYHYVIRRSGTLESEAAGKRCRPLDKSGAHVGDCGSGWNKRSIGICLVGGVDSENKPENNFTDAQMVTLKDLIEVLQHTFKDTKVMGHCDLIALNGAAPKACPSFDVLHWLDIEGI